MNAQHFVVVQMSAFIYAFIIHRKFIFVSFTIGFHFYLNFQCHVYFDQIQSDTDNVLLLQMMQMVKYYDGFRIKPDIFYLFLQVNHPLKCIPHLLKNAHFICFYNWFRCFYELFRRTTNKMRP